MIRVLLFLSLLSFSAFAQEHLDHDFYWHGKKRLLPANTTLNQLLLANGYSYRNLDMWKKLTMMMNGYKLSDFPSKKQTILYLPPKVSYKKWLTWWKKQPNYKSKAQCQRLNDNYIYSKTGQRKIGHIQYIKILAAKKKIARKEKLKRTSLNLPYCRNMTKRKIASKQITETVGEPSYFKKSSSIRASASYGKLNLTQDTNKFDMDILKTSGSYSYQFKKDQSIKASISATKFLNLKFNKLDDTLTPTDKTYFEFGGQYTRSYDNYAIGVAYDYLNYFVIGTLDDNETPALVPISINRISVRPSYFLNDNQSLFAGLGFIQSFEDTGIAGFDFALGTSYQFGSKKKYSITGTIYQSSVDSSESSKQDQSQYFGLSFSAKF